VHEDSECSLFRLIGYVNSVGLFNLPIQT